MKLLRFDKGASEHWDYDPIERTVHAKFRDGRVDIPVCTQKQPRIGAFFIHRRDEDTWMISPAMCIDRGSGFLARPASYDRLGVHCDFIHLVGAPSGVSEMLQDLYEEEVEEDTPTTRRLPT